MGFSGLLTDEGAKKNPLPKTCYIYPKMTKFGTVIPYLKKVRKTFESGEISLELCWHQSFSSEVRN